MLLHNTLPVDLPDLQPSAILILAFLFLHRGSLLPNNNDYDNAYDAIDDRSRLREFTLGSLMNVDRAPGGRQPPDQASRTGLFLPVGDEDHDHEARSDYYCMSRLCHFSLHSVTVPTYDDHRPFTRNLYVSR